MTDARSRTGEEKGGEGATVREATFALLRRLGLTTIFGNPGSTEEPFLQHFPKDFTYVLGLQESSVVAMADGYAQGTGRPTLVNLHTFAGLGHAMGSLICAHYNKTPLIITAGQQNREMLLLEPYLTNVRAVETPRPWVKWSYEPVKADDIPAAMMRAYAAALQPPAGPTFLSLPLDDLDKAARGEPIVHAVSHRVGPDPAQLDEFASASPKRTTRSWSPARGSTARTGGRRRGGSRDVGHPRLGAARDGAGRLSRGPSAVSGLPALRHRTPGRDAGGSRPHGGEVFEPAIRI